MISEVSVSLDGSAQVYNRQVWIYPIFTENFHSFFTSYDFNSLELLL